MTSLDYYAIEELLTDDERVARDRARRFVQEQVLREIVPFQNRSRIRILKRYSTVPRA